MRLAIVGGGIIGLASAWYLARAGAEVVIVERDAAGQGASWAAGGMLCAHVEHESDHPAFAALAKAALARWPGFAQSLEAVSGVDLGLNLNGAMVAAFDDGDERLWRDAVTRRAAQGAPLEWLGADDLKDLSPSLGAGLRGGVFSPFDGQVDNRAVCTALVKAVESAGVTIKEGCEVLSIESSGGRVTGLVTSDEHVEADGVILAAGAWTGSIKGLPKDLTLPVRPVKGQMAALQWEGPEAKRPHHVIWGPGIYCIPRGDGRIVLGATTEEAGFDPRLTAGGLSGLLSRAMKVLPALENMPLLEAWSGFRPGTPDNLPVLCGTSLEGLTIATGHYRNGILLAPVTAELVADLAMGRTPRLTISAFDARRFERRALADRSGEAAQDNAGSSPRMTT